MSMNLLVLKVNHLSRFSNKMALIHFVGDLGYRESNNDQQQSCTQDLLKEFSRKIAHQGAGEGRIFLLRFMQLRILSQQITQPNE